MGGEELPGLGRILIILGGVLFMTGLALLLVPKLPWLGRLPGDFRWERGDCRVYFPVGTSIAVSVILTLLVNLILRIFK